MTHRVLIWVPRRRSSHFYRVVVPAKNEAASLPQLVNEIACALRPFCEHSQRELTGFEIIIVDDGSSDLTQLVLQDLAAAYPELKRLVLSQSIGQSAATMAGIQKALPGFGSRPWMRTCRMILRSDCAFGGLYPTLDSAVLGWRVNRQDVWTKRTTSFWAK